jgi:hypothetical protein
VKTAYAVHYDESVYYFDDLQDLADFLVSIKETFEVMEQEPQVIIDTRRLSQKEWDALPEINLDDHC